jgi:hypothetical protein
MGTCRTERVPGRTQLNQRDPFPMAHFVERIFEQRAAVSYPIVGGDRLGTMQVTEGHVVEALQFGG